MKIEGLEKMIAEAPKRLVQVGNQAHLFVGQETFVRADALIKRSLSSGKTVIENGVTQWIEYRPLWDSAKEKKTSDRFIWHRDGDRVKCEKLHYYKYANGETTEVRLGFHWRDYLEVS